MTATEVLIWPDPPKMDIGAPHPRVERDGDTLWVAYRTQREGHFAILRFSGLQDLTFGGPNDEALDTHPLYSAGLQFHGFHEIHDPVLEEAGFRRWIIAFHDETLDVTALVAAIVVRAVQAITATHALAALRA